MRDIHYNSEDFKVPNLYLSFILMICFCFCSIIVDCCTVVSQHVLQLCSRFSCSRKMGLGGSCNFKTITKCVYCSPYPQVEKQKIMTTFPSAFRRGKSLLFLTLECPETSWIGNCLLLDYQLSLFKSPGQLCRYKLSSGRSNIGSFPSVVPSQSHTTWE